MTKAAAVPTAPEPIFHSARKFTEPYKGFDLAIEAEGYEIRKNGVTVHSRAGQAAPMTNAQCAKLYVDTHLAPQVINEPS